MSEDVPLSMATGDYEIMRALKEGAVRPEGIRLTLLSNTFSRDRTINMPRSLEVDCGEFNFFGYLYMFDQGMPWIGLPIYPHRRFRHGFLFVNTKKGYRKPSDLNGKRIAGGFGGAVGFWVKGIMNEHYGLDQRSVTWMVQGDPGGQGGAPYRERAGLTLERIPEGKNAEQLLLDGEIDALIGASFPQAFLDGDPRIGRLFADPHQVYVEYFKKTEIFPIMHAFKIRREIVEKHPWLPWNLCFAINQSKNIAMERVRNPRFMPMAFFEEAWEEQERLIGKDPWEYGLSKRNRKNLETAVRYAYESGLIKREYKLEEVFHPVAENAFEGGHRTF